MNVLEKEIEDLIFEVLKDGNSNVLNKRGMPDFCQYEVHTRQLDLGSYGRADMVSFSYCPFNKSLDILVTEIKKGEINSSTYFQALRYCKGLEVYVSNNYCLNTSFKVCLIGTSISLDDFAYLPDFNRNLSIYTVKIDLDNGVKFKKEQRYKISNATDPQRNPKLLSLLNTAIRRNIREKVNQYNPF